MTESVFELPEIESMQTVDLVAHRTLGTGSDVPRAENRISIGGPIVVAMTADKVPSADLAAFVKSEAATSRYSLLKLQISFHDEPGAPITQAAVALLLVSDGAQSAPLAWSMDPTRLDRPPKQVSKTIGLTAQLGFVGPTAQAQVVQQQPNPLLVALGQLESTPEWQFRGAAGDPLFGMYALTLICKIPTGAQAHANLGINARIERKTLGVFPYGGRYPG